MPLSPAPVAARVTALAAALVVAAGTAVLAVPVASAAPTTDTKVTSCHRTHSLTKPYRKITVSSSAAFTHGASEQGNGHVRTGRRRPVSG